MADLKMEAAIIFETFLPNALQRALEYAGNDLYGYDAVYSMGGDATLGGMARYIAVAPRDVATSLRNLDFGI
ncbi:MAG: hypothetical protein IIA09_14630 [Proteobacteria bacterium]|nr:hypothetical protein [Pseudomonadota bacterium]